MEQYNQFEIILKPYNVDLVSGVLWELEISGITENEDKNSIMVYSKLNSNVNSYSVKTLLDSMRVQNLIESFEIIETSIENKNWNEEWEKKFSPVRIGKNFIVKPSFKDYQSTSDDIVITIDPKMSFGTGEHETTQLILEAIEKINFKGFRVLDVGTGTAILAIAAAKLGASSVTGIDNDEWCKLNGEENVELNGVKSIVEIKLCELHQLDNSQFDIILANINKHILIEISDLIFSRLKKPGILILSGLLISDQEGILKHYEAYSLNKIDILQKNEWIAMVLSQ